METTPNTVVIAWTTLPVNADAEAFVRTLLDAGVIACGTILPGARSVFRWEGRVDTTGEALVMLKTTAAGVPALRTALVAAHPYEMPELLVVPCTDGLPAYLAWVRGEVAPG